MTENNDIVDTFLSGLGLSYNFLIDTFGYGALELSDLKTRLTNAYKQQATSNNASGGSGGCGCDGTDIDRFIFRASKPVTMAIEICAQAKLLSYLKNIFPLYDFYQSIEIPKILTQTIDLFSGETCDPFLPDIFAPLCSCVGTCGDPSLNRIHLSPNLITYFYSDKLKRDKPGMWGCQAACQEEDDCKFWTLSKVYEGNTKYDDYNQDSDVHRCYLWRNCDQFYIPAGTTNNPFAFEAGRPYNIITDHWSGIKNCTNYNRDCPLVNGSTGEFKVSIQILLLTFSFHFV